MIDVRPWIREAWIDELKQENFKQIQQGYHREERKFLFFKEDCYCALGLIQAATHKFNPELKNKDRRPGRYHYSMREYADLVGISPHLASDVIWMNDSGNMRFPQIAAAVEEKIAKDFT